MAKRTSVGKLRDFPGNCLETHGIECNLHVDNEYYQKFENRRTQNLIIIIPLTTTIYSCHSLIQHLMLFTGSDVISYGIIVSGFCLLVQLLSLTLLCLKLRLIREKVTKLFIGIFVTLNVTNISIDIAIANSSCLQSKIHWILILVYILYGTLQIPRGLCCVTSFVIFCVVIIVSGNNATLHNQHVKQSCDSLLQLLAISVLGICSYTSTQNDLLSFFVKGEKVTKTRRRLRQEIDAQRTLVTSVLPINFADEIYRDFDDVSQKPFRKMYITKHDKVSILFADIVGFTYLSSFCSAVQLVNLLNKIFANFDKTALKYHQVRLKILGDCYYCICGVPNYRADHALLSIKMGLGMIDIIQSISSKVNMRIGIHTGSVLSGVLGLYQWQFDILGKHVTIANKMESSGRPGRIHITEATKACIGTEFELESSDAGQKVAFLKRYDIRTYFVKDRKDTMSFETYFPNDVITDENAPDPILSYTVIDDDAAEDTSWTKSLDTRDRTRNKMSRFTLHFESSAEEHRYRRHYRSRLPLGQICFAFILYTGMSENKRLTDGIHFFIGTAVLLTSILHFNTISRKNLILDVFETVLLCLSAALVVGLHVTGLADCHISSFTESNSSVATVDGCLSPYPCITRAMLILIGLNEAICLGHVIKTIILIGLVSTYIAVVFVLRTPVAGAGISLSALSYDVTPFFVMDLAGSLFGVMIILCFLERQKDIIKRKLFLWQEEMADQQKKDEEVQHRNEALLCNIFVPRIAEEFLNSRRREDELYSQAYDNVGVMFAACPHFEEFYTENSSFEDGLGSVRFLNEILSDYDQLLSEERFKELCKIKTIGSTYMVASGLLPRQNDHVDTRRSKRWGHLDTLVNFAVEMKQVLNAINESSFNNFQLRIGISHGSVVAGVIGVKKPHYDIWGNTVNVASRMESTGTVGEIQVLPETMLILQRYGHTFKPRGVVNVKGKGDMMTYFWTGNSQSSFT